MAAAKKAAAPEPDDKPAPKARAKRRVIEAGGHLISADPEVASPEPIVPCGVCGARLGDDGCPNGHGAADDGGWNVGGDA